MTKETTSQALFSNYVIDGVRQDMTPAQILDSVCDTKQDQGDEYTPILDEILEPGLIPLDFDRSKIQMYLDAVLSTEREFPLAYAPSITRNEIARTLIDSLWRGGHFRLGDISLDAFWSWNDKELGSMAAFYSSAAACAEFLDALGVNLLSYSYKENVGKTSVRFVPGIYSMEGADDSDILEPYRSASPQMVSMDICPHTFVADTQSWIVYIPFDTADYSLGGSLLVQALGMNGGVPLQTGDADYFMDCFEVVRELVEDKILLSAGTVGPGGLAATLKRMTSPEVGASVNISDLVKSKEGTDVVKALFSEVPGVVIQIRDIDFDYLDAELLLQDVLYFPLGHPVLGTDELSVRSSAKSGIQVILETLMQNAEGED